MRFAGMVGLFLAGSILVGCGGGDGDGDAEADEALEQTVVMSDLAFDPAVVDVPVGQLVRLQFHNQGALIHDFTVDEMPHHRQRMTGASTAGGHMHDGEFAMHYALDPAARGYMEFEATEPGEYEFYCTVPGHREAGMHGTLRVR